MLIISCAHCRTTFTGIGVVDGSQAVETTFKNSSPTGENAHLRIVKFFTHIHCTLWPFLTRVAQQTPSYTVQTLNMSLYVHYNAVYHRVDKVK